MTASQVKQYQAKKISCWSNSWGKKLMVRTRPWLLLAVCETRLEEQRPSLVSRPRYASSCRAVVLNFTLFCINWLYTENQTWMFTSSWSERGFDVTSEELLHCLTELVSGKRPCWAECRGGSPHVPPANASKFMVCCRRVRVSEPYVLTTWMDVVVAGCFGI